MVFRSLEQLLCLVLKFLIDHPSILAQSGLPQGIASVLRCWGLDCRVVHLRGLLQFCVAGGSTLGSCQHIDKGSRGSRRRRY
eukprot:2799048-Amphidinium_carterae.1